MANIKIYGDIESGSMFFVGSTVDPKPLGVVIASEHPTRADRIVIKRNDRFKRDKVSFRVLFRRLNINRICNKQGEELVATLGYDRAQVVEYINAQSNLQGGTAGGDGSGTDMIGTDVSFKLDDTSTSIMISSGHEFGVNTIKAINNNGVIDIVSVLGDLVHFTNLEVGRISGDDGNLIAGGINDVINYLNELFTVGPFEQVVISDPEATTIADVGGVDDNGTFKGVDALDPITDDLWQSMDSGTNDAGYLSTQDIDQAGEYFTFDIRGKGTYMFGLVHTDSSYNAGLYTGSSVYADPSVFCNNAAGTNANHGFQFAFGFHIGNAHASWTLYGANTAYRMGEAWYDHANSFDMKDEWNADQPVKMRVGLDNDGYISVWSKGDEAGEWKLHARTTYAAKEGASFRLGIKLMSNNSRINTMPKYHLLAATAPTMYFRYIESPDGNFEYPLFATTEEAEYYDIQNGGTGTYHTHTYTDDPTNTTWYMPDTNGVMNGTSAPAFDMSLGSTASYTEITSLSNADQAPPQFSQADMTRQEGDSVIIQINPADTNYSTSVSISPLGSGLVFDGGSILMGTLNDVAVDTTYTITVTRANSYGSTTGSMDLTVTNVAPTQTQTTPFTKALDFAGSNEYAVTVNASALSNPVRMDGVAMTTSAPTIAGNTSSDSNARPWATAIVFKADGHNSNQHIWNQGEGANNGDDNIYLRLSAARNLYLGWGREGDGINELEIGYIGGNINGWWGVYIAHNGTRWSGSNATASNLADTFDVRLMSNNTNGGWGVGSNLSTIANWGQTGARMDRAVNGYFSVGGRRGNRSFHGKVASMVNTTLKRGDSMPTDAEIKEMVTDPIQWVTDYKVGESYRPSHVDYNNSNFALGGNSETYSTSVWLMGDGTSDSYANGMRNYIQPSEQNYTKLQLNSMVSNDIQSVTIQGLT